MTQASRPWSAIDSAPYETPVEIRVAGRRKPFLAKLLPNHSLDSDEREVDQWVAINDDYPRCWSDGACWESNADEQMSAQPTHWRPTP